MGGGDDFFDDFGKGEGLFTTEEQHAQIRDLLVSGGGGKSGEGGEGGLQAALSALLLSLASPRYSSLEEAAKRHPIDPYLRALGDPQALEAMRAEAAAAAKCARDAEAERAAAGVEAGGKGTWEPPPDDEEPETAQDME